MNKIAIVTGCAKGIGRKIVLELAHNNYDIIGTYNTSLDEINDLKNELDNYNINFNYYKVDLSNDEELDDFINNIKSNYNKIDLLINNAALSIDDDFKLKTKEEFMKVLEVNLVAPFLLIQKLSELLKNGIIINICSTDGINTYSKLNMDYSASKAGLINLTKSLSLELTTTKVYGICPNWVNTESVREMDSKYLDDELKRVGQKKLIEPIEIAKKVIELTNSNLESGSIIVMEDNNG